MPEGGGMFRNNQKSPYRNSEVRWLLPFLGKQAGLLMTLGKPSHFCREKWSKKSKKSFAVASSYLRRSFALSPTIGAEAMMCFRGAFAEDVRSVV